MTRALSTGFRSFLHRRAPGDEELLLIRLLFPGFGTLRYAQNSKGTIVSGGQSYEGRSFSLPLPTDEDGVVETSLDLDVTGLSDDTVAAILDYATGRPEVEADLVLLSDPETVETTFYFQMKNAEAPAQVLRAALSYEPILSEPWPGPVFDAVRFPDLFP